MKVGVISSEIIKPSSPTPEHLRRYQLSFPDQLCPRAYNPVLYYYKLNEHQSGESNYVADISNKLKKSLSQALTLYYPLAGRLIGNTVVYCNDDGALYLEAQVESQLSDVVQNEQVPLSELNKLLPSRLDETAEYLLGVQLNFFACGGIAISVCISHKLADALSCFVFARNWLAIARSENDAVARPEFIASTTFPPLNVGEFDSSSIAPKGEANVTKRYAIDARKIEALRAKYEKIRTNCELGGSQNVSKRISRVETLSSFIWSRFVAATSKDVGFESASNKFYKIRQAVNLRSKFDPPLPENSFGNYIFSSATTASIVTSRDPDNYCYELAKEMGEEIRKINKDFILYMRENGDKFLGLVKKEAERMARGEVAGTFIFTSLCRFPLYEADFGSGKPIWVSSVNRGFANVVHFQDNKNGDGVEVYICLKAEDMAKFEADQEFLAFVSPIVPSS